MRIIKVRQEMITIGVAKGLNNPETVNLSQELDSLLNQYFQLSEQRRVCYGEFCYLNEKCEED
ncbi:aspartyl-phosphate phosphatase Spo0E family protein [Bacillus sp. IITD106]|nr:aspartyl-phosphate phosphatase Spo0E family protein [Bacillus sp. IITD106]